MIKILEYYHHQKSPKIYEHIIKPAKKLLQKCSYKSIADTNHLCALAYWLYIYDNKEIALEICELCHTVNFDFKYREIGMQNIYGLEIALQENFWMKIEKIVSSSMIGKGEIGIYPELNEH